MRGQAPGRIVFYRRKVKSRGCKSGGRSIAIAACQYFVNPGGCLPAAAHINKRADDVAYHVLQKRVRGKLEANEVPPAADLQLAQSLDRGLGLAFGGAKGAEIMLADEALRALLHRVQPAGPLIAEIATGPRADLAQATVLGFGALYEGSLARTARLPGAARR